MINKELTLEDGLEQIGVPVLMLDLTFDESHPIVDAYIEMRASIFESMSAIPPSERRKFNMGNDFVSQKCYQMQLFVNSKAFEINWFMLLGGTGRTIAVASTEEPFLEEVELFPIQHNRI